MSRLNIILKDHEDDKYNSLREIRFTNILSYIKAITDVDKLPLGKAFDPEIMDNSNSKRLEFTRELIQINYKLFIDPSHWQQ